MNQKLKLYSGCLWVCSVALLKLALLAAVAFGWLWFIFRGIPWFWRWLT